MDQLKKYFAYIPANMHLRHDDFYVYTENKK